MNRQAKLLLADEPPAFWIDCATGISPYFLICDHAGNRIPDALDSLGLTSSDLERHIAWDIGAAAVAAHLSAALDAFLIMQTYSRLVIDCNRPLGTLDSIVTQSECTRVPGNESISDADADLRAREIFHPYHDRIRRELDARQRRHQPSFLVALHSFTPSYLGVARPWHVGVLYHRDARLARRLLELLRRDAALVVGDNEPYSVSDETDYAIPEHGERRGIPHVELEIRQDLIGDEAGQKGWAARLAKLFVEASATLI